MVEILKKQKEFKQSITTIEYRGSDYNNTCQLAKPDNYQGYGHSEH